MSLAVLVKKSAKSPFQKVISPMMNPEKHGWKGS
jgi:hypothetical protein